MRGKDLFEKITDIDDKLIITKDKKRKPNKNWIIPIVACFALIICVFPMIQNTLTDNEKDPVEWECMIEYNDKIYSVVTSIDSPAYEKYNLEKTITSDLVGNYLGEQTIQTDNDGNMDTFKIYTYIKSPTTSYDWYPRLIVEDTDGDYFHALIGSVFKEGRQTASEVLEVYGLSSSSDIVSIENENGHSISDEAFITQFYNGIFTKEYGGNDFMQKNVYQDTGIDESEIGKLYSKYADDMVCLKVELENGIVIGVDFTSHNYVRVDHELYFKVDDDTLALLDIFK